MAWYLDHVFASATLAQLDQHSLACCGCRCDDSKKMFCMYYMYTLCIFIIIRYI